MLRSLAPRGLGGLQQRSLGRTSWVRTLAGGADASTESNVKSLVGVEKIQVAGKGVAMVYMQRAPVNSLSGALISELTETIKELERDPEMQGMVLGSREKAFCAGLDLNEVYKVSESHFCKYWGSFEELWHTLYVSRLVTAAAIESHSPAAGSVLALACDYRVLADNPKLRMGLNETQLGMVCPRWLQALCARTVGERHSEFLLQHGHMMAPEEALKYGFVDEVVPKEEVMNRVLKFLETPVQLPPNARAATKVQQREKVAAMAGPNSGKELWSFVSSEESQASIEKIMQALKSSKRK
mmetsp:Transcript_20297/g.39797  ORF Transcript_20297/g.39797 Transcript_20297/m.39797 type:complete len:298 (-) Transcript_20297:1529-2422(-)